MGFWETIFPVTAVGSIVVAAVGLIVNEAIKRVFSKDLERFKADVAKSAYEHQVRFSRLHEKRAEVIAEVYGHIRLVEGCLNILLNLPESELDRLNTYCQMGDAAKNLIDSLKEGRIWLDEPVCLKIDSFLDMTEPLAKLLGQCSGLQQEQLSRITQPLQVSLVSIRKELENEFRTILKGSACSK